MAFHYHYRLDYIDGLDISDIKMLGRYISQQNGGDNVNQHKQPSDNDLKRKLELMDAHRQENSK